MNTTQRLPCVELQVSDAALARAVAAVVQDSPSRPLGDVVVSDDARRLGDRLVLVVRATAADAANALRHLSLGRIAGVVSDDMLEDLPAVIAAVGSGLVTATRRVAELACHAPRLTPRQTEVLEALMLGGSNARIASTLRLSEATVKRELAAVAAAFGTTTRLGVLTAAYASGYRPAGNAQTTGSTIGT